MRTAGQATGEGLLSGIRVLDLTHWYSGPYATLLLAGLGAEIIRVADPRLGDPVASAPPFAGAEGVALGRQTDDDLGLAYLKRNRGKKSITLNLKAEEGRSLFFRLVCTADVVVENFRPGVAERLGIDYATLSALNPAIVYCSITGYGASGPDRTLKAYDTMVQAASGLMSITGEQGGRPLKAGSALSDGIAGSFATSAILAALLRRSADGQGQLVDVSMVDCLLSLVLDEPLDNYGRLGIPFRQGNRLTRFSPFNSYRAADGYVVIGVATSRDWECLLDAIERPDLKGDPDFSRVSWRIEHNDRVDDLIATWCAPRMKREIEARMKQHDVACSAVMEIDDIAAREQTRHRQMIEPVRHPSLGALPSAIAAAFPLKFSRSKSGYETPAPQLGEHNQEILGGILGLGNEELERLKQAGVI